MLANRRVGLASACMPRFPPALPDQHPQAAPFPRHPSARAMHRPALAALRRQ